MNVDKFKRSLKALKGHLTRANNDSDKIIQSPTPEVSDVQATINILDSKWKAYSDAYDKLETELLENEGKEDEVEKIHDDFYPMYSLYEHQSAKLKALLVKSSQAATDAKTESNSNIVSALPKLPSIKLPTFDGDLTDYEPFIDQFIAQIGSRVDLEPVTKLQYLKTQLKGRALELVKGYSCISANYQCALDTLKETYGDEEKIKHCLLQKIVNLDSPKPNRDSLEAFRVSMLNLTRSLRNKHDYTCCEWILASLFQHKLPNVTIRQLYLKYEVNYFTLLQMNEGIRDLISHMEIESRQKTAKNPKQEPPSQNGLDSYKERNVGSYFNTGMETKAKKLPRGNRCRFCGDSHYDTQCTKYATGSERIQRLKELKMCTRCMGPHHVKTCQTNLQTCRKCKRGAHHSTLCKTYDKPNVAHSSQDTITQKESKESDHTQAASNVGHVNITGATITKSSGVALSTAIAKLQLKGSGRNIRLFFDSGSQKTFITKSLVDESGLPIKQSTTMTLKGFMGQPVTKEVDIVKPLIKMGNRLKRVTAVVVDELPATIITAGLTEAMKHLAKKGIPLAEQVVENDKVGPVDLLIGSDYYFEFISLNTTVCEGLHLLKSSAGYIITGKIPSKYNVKENESTGNASQYVTPEAVLVMRITQEPDPLMNTETQLLHELPVHKLWDLDVIGIDATQPLPEDKTAYHDYLDTVQYEENQYWVRLPFKINKPDLEANYSRAVGQMHSLVKELKGKGQAEHYQHILDEQLESKFIEEVPNALPTDDNVHYLPHHGVKKNSVTTPLRIVFNCSSKPGSQSPSLNECLMTGPSLTKKLGDVLLRFRTGKFAYTADISKAFLRIGLQEQDRNYTRFLWPSDVHDPGSPIKTYRFRSVLFGATSSPFLLQATIDYHLRKSNSHLKETLANNFYVDNFQGSTSDEGTLLETYKEANKELNLANMPLRQWSTNNHELQTIINEDFPGYEIPKYTSLLGLQWDIAKDTLKIKAVRYSDVEKLTKRLLLMKVSKLFDPLGIFTPITIKGKILLQDSWKLKVDWDDVLPDDYTKQWEPMEKELQQIVNYDVPRSTINEGEECSLHIFCDASSKAYGAAAYIVAQERSHLLTSKVRVSPLKPRTIPQMELTGLLIGVKLGKHILETLEHITIRDTYIWSDNEAALQWIKNDNSKIPYVKNRVADIHEMQAGFSFMYVDTKSNPADLLSRGTTIDSLMKDSLWLEGPKWLKNKCDWPEQKAYVISNICIPKDVPVKRNEQQHLLIDIARFSSLGKLQRVTQHILLFINNIMAKRGWTNRQITNSPTTILVKQIQGHCYPEELDILSSLSSNDPRQPKPSKKILGTNTEVRHLGAKPSKKTLASNKLINDLGLFLDSEGLIRCQGRVHNSSLHYSAKHPALLPKHHEFTELVIKDAHIATLHGGTADTLVRIRKTFWIPKVRQVIKSTIKKCTTCRRYDSRTLSYPGPPPLPDERVTEARPFQVVGIDYTGAIMLKNPEHETEGESAKVYICLFTCATTRAVHLELVTDSSASTFLRAFRRFTGRRSCPQLVITDNGTNFKASEIFIRNFFQLPEVQEFFESRKCNWRFIPPKAPWQGGFYERMIGIVKRSLRKVLHNKRATVDELRTLIVEIEARVNNRPLTYIQEDINEPEALTPNHLLQGYQIDTIPPVMNMERSKDPDYIKNVGNINTEKLNKRFNHLNKILKQWNRIWKDDYLTSLREHQYGPKGNRPNHQLSPGDIVIINCDTARSTWPIGKILSLLPDKYGTLRVVKVLSKGNVSLRTIDKLIPLEISSPAQEVQTFQQRPKRDAAVKARERWQNQTGSDV